MIKKLTFCVLLSLFVFLFSCSDPVTPKPTPPNVTLSGLDLTWDQTTLPPDIVIWIEGTATNSGQTAAQNVQAQLVLMDANYNVLSTGTWQTIFNTLNAGSSLGFVVFWISPYPSTACYNTAHYQVKVQWSNNSIQYEYTFDGESIFDN